jgi:uncharacterized protein YbaP (TraB family)
MNRKSCFLQFNQLALSIFLTVVFPFTSMAQGIVYLRQEFKQQNPFLYQVEKDGKVSHILGSLHVGIPLNSYPDEVFVLAAKSKNMAFEADVDDLKKNHANAFDHVAKYPDGQTLEQNLSPKAIKKLKEIFGENSIIKLNSYRPWVIANELSNDLIDALKRESPELWDYNFGIDTVLLQQAKRSQKSIILLDDLSKKVSSINEETTVLDLEKLLAYPDPIGHLYSCAAMAQRFYLAGNQEGFKIFNQTCETPNLLKNLQSRTIAWMPKIESLLTKGDSFIVVGADHMNGPSGLQSLLESKGYKVKRVLSEPIVPSVQNTRNKPINSDEKVK